MFVAVVLGVANWLLGRRIKKKKEERLAFTEEEAEDEDEDEDEDEEGAVRGA